MTSFTKTSALALILSLGTAGAAIAQNASAQKTNENACWSKLSQFDANGDGILAGDEIDKNRSTVFGVLDRNSDKAISREEYVRCVSLQSGEKSAIIASFDVFDSDNDDRLTDREFAAHTGGANPATTIVVVRRIPVVAVVAQDWDRSRPFDTSKLRAEELLGKDVVNLNGNEVGEIGDVVMDRDGKVAYAVVDVGGFLGMGEKQVAVPFDELRMTNANAILMSEKSEDQLTRMPAYKKDMYRPFAR